MDMLVMDDGWFGKRNNDQNSLGDWFVNEDKLKGGLGELIRRINDLGLQFGIWYEPEMISPDSDLFRAHPDWCVHVPNRKPCIGRHQYVLDMSRKDVRDNIFDQMYSVLSKYKIDYIKWDFNRNISDAGSALLPADRQGEFFHRFILGTYELMGRIRDAFPDMLFENCSGGGGRFDPAMLAYSQQIWASDNTDPIERLTIQFGTSMCYPASTMGAHVSACDRTDYKVKGDVALWGTFGYELDPNELSAEERGQVKSRLTNTTNTMTSFTRVTSTGSKVPTRTDIAARGASSPRTRARLLQRSLQCARPKFRSSFSSSGDSTPTSTISATSTAEFTPAPIS